MKFASIALFCAALLAVSWPARSWADEVDALLYDEPLSATEEVRSSNPTLADTLPSDPSANFSVIGGEAAEYSEPKHWHATIGQPSPESNKAVRTEPGLLPPPPAEQETAPAVAFSAVPEPSAVALAVLALVYFLLFGRRRSPV